MNYYKIICIFTSVLFVYLFTQLMFFSNSFVIGLGLEPSTVATVLARRASIFMLGISVLMFFARNLQNSKPRQIICLSTGITMFGLACMGSYEYISGNLNTSIFTAIAIESGTAISFAFILFKDRKTYANSNK